MNGSQHVRVLECVVLACLLGLPVNGQSACGTPAFGTEAYGGGLGGNQTLELGWMAGPPGQESSGTLYVSGGTPGGHLFIGVTLSPANIALGATTLLIPATDPATAWLISDPGYASSIPNPAPILQPFDPSGTTQLPMTLEGPLPQPFTIYAQAFEAAAPLTFSNGLAVTFAGPGRRFYVSGNGNDNDPGTQALPFRSISRLLQEGLSDRDTVLFEAGGVYDDATLFAVGVRDLTIGMYGVGSKPLLQAANERALIHLLDCPCGTIEDLLLRNGPDHPLVLLEGNVDGARVAGVNTNGGKVGIWIKNNAVGHVTIEGGQFRNAYFDTISTAGSATAEVSYCDIRNTGQLNTTPGAGDPLSAHETSTIDAHHNVLINNRRGAFVHINTDGENRFWNNCVQAHDVVEVCMQQSAGFGLGGRTTMFNNVIQVTGSVATKVINANTNGHIDCFNNTIVNLADNPQSFNVCAIDGTVNLNNSILFVRTGLQVIEVGGYVGRRNVFWSDGPGGLFISGLSFTALLEFNQWQSIEEHDLTSIEANPMIANVMGSAPADFQILPGSPATGLSSNESARFTVDFFSTLRPTIGTWDTGFHERP